MNDTNQSINVFVSYSHLNSDWVNPENKNNLIPFLQATFGRKGVKFWWDHDLNTLPGIEYEKKITQEIINADIAILLLSQDFLNSEFIRDKEFPLIKERYDQGLIALIPILVASCDFDDEDPFEQFFTGILQIIPSEQTPLIDYAEESESKYGKAKQLILKAFRRRLKEIYKSRSKVIDGQEKKSANEDSSKSPESPVSGDLNDLKRSQVFPIWFSRKYVWGIGSGCVVISLLFLGIILSWFKTSETLPTSNPKQTDEIIVTPNDVLTAQCDAREEMNAIETLEGVSEAIANYSTSVKPSESAPEKSTKEKDDKTSEDVLLSGNPVNLLFNAQQSSLNQINKIKAVLERAGGQVNLIPKDVDISENRIYYFEARTRQQAEIIQDYLDEFVAARIIFKNDPGQLGMVNQTIMVHLAAGNP